MKDNLKQWFDKKYKGKKLYYNHRCDMGWVNPIIVKCKEDFEKDIVFALNNHLFILEKRDKFNSEDGYIEYFINTYTLSSLNFLAGWFKAKNYFFSLNEYRIIDADKKLFNVKKTIENKDFYLCTNVELKVNIVNVADNSPYFYIDNLGKIEKDKNDKNNLLYKYKVNVREEVDFVKIKKDSLKFFNDGKPLKGTIILYIVEE